MTKLQAKEKCSESTRTTLGTPGKDVNEKPEHESNIVKKEDSSSDHIKLSFETRLSQMGEKMTAIKWMPIFLLLIFISLILTIGLLGQRISSSLHLNIEINPPTSQEE